MPFTVSHVAAVLPGVSTVLPAAALVVGAMSPDIPYFLPRGPWALPTHTIGGVLLWAPLLGLVALVAWHALVARAAYAWAPASVRARLPAPVPARERVGSLQSLALAWCALVVGAATHVAWDAFTHDDGWVVTHRPELVQTVTWLPGHLAAYRWAQYASSVIGVVVLAWWIARWWRTAEVRDAVAVSRISDAARWLASLTVCAAGLLGAIVASWPYLTGPDGVNLRRAVFRAITVGGATASLVVLVLALGWSVAQSRASTRPPA